VVDGAMRGEMLDADRNLGESSASGGTGMPAECALIERTRAVKLSDEQLVRNRVVVREDASESRAAVERQCPISPPMSR
jgi:hypothetical protein